MKRLTEERNAAMQEYSMIMSERDSVHKEIEKLQDEVSNTNSKMKEVEGKTKIHDDEKRKLVCQIEVCSLFFLFSFKQLLLSPLNC